MKIFVGIMPMKTYPVKPIFAVLIGCFVNLAVVHADVSVPSLFSDHMVLQRDKPIQLWGWAEPGEAVNIQLDGIVAGTIADKSGEWKLTLPPMPAGGPYSLILSGNNEIQIENILLGEVWIASGQSNMQWTVDESTNADLAILTANHQPQIRYVQVRNKGSQTPISTTDKVWQRIGSTTVGNLSAVGYAFAETLNNILGVPIGVIDTAWGSSTGEAWIDRELIKNDPKLQNIHENWLDIEANWDQAAVEAAYKQNLAKWRENAAKAEEAGLKPPRKPGWPPPNRMDGQRRPGNLWNARVLPIAPYSVRGVIWYQGESNSGPPERARQYHHLFSTLIGEWRQLWGEDFPFYWAQLADFHEESTFAESQTWPFLRESQTRTMNSVENTGQAVIIDLGEGNDIHPREKEEVGRRLARWALHKDYGFTNLAYRSPEYAAWRQEDNRVVVDFNYTGDGLRPFDTDIINGFVIQSDDGEWQVVEGRVYNEHSVVISVEEGMTVTAVRYAWANNPVCNLFSLNGLPVTPFRSDSD